MNEQDCYPREKTKLASRQGNHWLIVSPNFFHLFVTRPSEICVVFKDIHTANNL